MNDTECDNLIKSLQWSDPAKVISLSVLLFIILLVISGNSLVIAAVFCSNKLRSVTNYFIVNLAVADLLVGLAVLPFSATWEVFKVWIFGDIWCRVWLAVDVWMCTASILNLCAISLDRYVAVTRPVTYPNIMSTKRAKFLIAGIWVLSFVICFPPLVGWKDQKVQPTFTRGNYTLLYSNTASSSGHLRLQHDHNQRQQKQQDIWNAMPAANEVNYHEPAYTPLEIGELLETTTAAKFVYGNPICSSTCELTNDRGYVLYSALGSFYIPMFVMLFFYWRIYRAAVRTTRAIKQGFKTTKVPHVRLRQYTAQVIINISKRDSPNNNRGFPVPLSLQVLCTLRFLGRNVQQIGIGSPRDASNGGVSDTPLVLRIHRGRPCNAQQRTPLSVHSMSSTLSVNSNCEDGFNSLHNPGFTCQSSMPRRATSMRVNRQRHEKISIKVSFPSSENVLDLHTSVPSSPPPYSSALVTTQRNKSALTNGRRASFKTSLFEIGETVFNTDDCVGNIASSVVDSPRDIEMCFSGDSGSNSSAKRRGGKRSAKFQVKRFRMETKAAKTLAIIVGGFIFCWLPFFTIYLVRAFCEECIEPTIFSVLFWLGYCNSAVNPLIYALFSNEFRNAFKRIICRCVCTRSGFRASENFQLIAARAFMAPATFHKTISGCSDDEDGSKSVGSRFDEQRLTLRIHRGRCLNQNDSTYSNGSTQSTTTSMGTPSPERLSKYTTRRPPCHDKIKISVSYASNENINVLDGCDSACSQEPQPFGSSTMLYAVRYNSSNGRETTESQLYPYQGSCHSYPLVGRSMSEIMQHQSQSSDFSTIASQQQRNKRIGRRNLITQVKRFRMETRAAKTLAIIVGLFIFCWLPFFTIYVIRAFCQDCIDPLVFSILFWLGYCNSAANPMIYALFSKDFRYAFKSIICHCSCAHESIALKNSRRGSDISTGRYRGRTPSVTPSAAAHSLGDESEVRERTLSITPSAAAQSLGSESEMHHQELRRDLR